MHKRNADDAQIRLVFTSKLDLRWECEGHVEEDSLDSVGEASVGERDTEGSLHP